MKWIKAHKSFIIWALFFCLLSFGTGVFQKHYLPKIKIWSLKQIEKLSNKHAPVYASAKSIEFDLFPIGITLNEVRVVPKGDLAKQITPTVLGRASAHLSFWSFITGRLELSKVHLHDFDLKIFIKSFSEKSKLQGFDFSILSDIPVQRFIVTKAKVWAQDYNAQLSVHAPRVNFEVINRKLALLATLDARSFRVKKTGDKAIFDSDISFRLRADKDRIVLNRVRIKKKDSFILASGEIDWQSENLKFIKVAGKTRSLIQMRDIEYLGKEFFPRHNIPSLRGRVFLELSTDHVFGKSLKGDARLRTRSLEVDQFIVGDVKAVGTVDESLTQFSSINIQHPGGNVNLEGLELELKPPYKVESKLTGSKVNIHPLLKALKVEDIAIFSSISPDFNCSGQIQSPLKITCKGKATAEHVTFYVEPDKKKEIVSIKDISANATVVVGPNSVSYNANAKSRRSTANSNGTISYDKKYLLNIESEKVNLADVEHISGFKFNGDVKGSGTLQSVDNNMKALFDLEGKGFKYENWLLDELKTEFGYYRKELSFKKISGLVQNSKYEGQLLIDLNKGRFSIDANIPKLDLAGINDITPPSFPIPDLQSAGIGRAIFTLDGPFELAKTNWSLNLNTKRGVVLGESFDQAIVYISSEAGKLSSRQCVVGKGNGRLSCSLTGDLTKNSNLRIKGENLSLEQSETIQNYIENVSGFTNFELDISDLANNFNIDAKGKLQSLQLSDLPIQNIIFDFKKSPSLLSGRFRLGDDVIDTAFSIEANKTYKLNGSFNNWDFSRFFSAFSDSLRVNTYEANLRGNFNIAGSIQNLDMVDGKLDIDSMYLRSNNIKIENTQPMSITLEKGSLTPKNLYLEGMDNYIRLKKSDANSPVALTAEGRLEMTLLSLLTPFFDDLKGLMNFSLDLRGRISKLKFSGNTYIQNGFVKLKEFPHPIEEYSADILFDNNKLVINSAKGKLAGGNVSGTGQILFNGFKDIPVDIRGSFIDSSFEVPKGFFTRGSGDFNVSGQWLPYKLGVNFNITNGRINSELEDDDAAPTTINPSPFLPASARGTTFTPIVLDLNITLPNQMPVNMLVARLDIRAQVGGNIKVKGEPLNPRLTGRIRIEKGSQVIFRENQFEILSGYIHYENSEPSNPNVNVTAYSRATAKVGATEEREIDITLRIIGPAQNPEVNVSSQPSLSEKDLISLLAFGFIPTTNQNSQSTNPSYQLGNVVVNELFGFNKTIRKNFGVEFDYSSSFDAENNSDTHTIRVKKQWTPKFGASVSRSFGKTNKNNVRAEYKINNKWSVIGSYEGEEQAGSNLTTTDNEENSQFGVDLEYKVDFK